MTLYLLGTGAVFSQASDSLLNVMRLNCAAIKNNLQSYDTVRVSILDESMEGGYAIGFHNNLDFKLIEVTWFGEMGMRTVEYFFVQGQLCMAFNTDFIYNRPIYWDEKTAKEMDDKEVFDPSKTRVKEDRYYFQDNKLIRWLDGKHEVNRKLVNCSAMEYSMLTHAEEMKERLGSRNGGMEE